MAVGTVVALPLGASIARGTSFESTLELDYSCALGVTERERVTGCWFEVTRQPEGRPPCIHMHVHVPVQGSF